MTNPTLTTITADAAVLADGRGGDGGGFFAVLGFVLLVIGGIALYRAIRRRRHPEIYGPEAMRRRHRRHRASSAEAILAERFAKGELSETEYRTARTVLLEDDDDPPTST
ncbi:MAG: SHOCT domain-containing protein [Actinomycetota bacterium]